MRGNIIIYLITIFSFTSASVYSGDKPEINNSKKTIFILTHLSGVELTQEAFFYSEDSKIWKLHFRNGETIKFTIIGNNKENTTCGIKAEDSSGQHCKICVSKSGDTTNLEFNYKNKKIIYSGYSHTLQNEDQFQKFKEYFIDSTDNALDVSGFLNSDVGFLPIPIVITEPALGLGGGLGAVYFHNKKKREGETRKGELPPVLSMGAGIYTSNKTWVAMLAHQGSYAKDRWRYTGALVYMSVNLKYYQKSNQPNDQFGFNYNMKGFMTFHELLMRPNREVPAFIGFNYVYFNNNVSFDPSGEFPGLEPLEGEINLGGLNIVSVWDTRDNIFTPTSGNMSAIEFGKFSKIFGGDNDYWNFGARSYFYLPIISDKLFSGYRIALNSKWGDNVPFYELPFVSLRGIPMMRYQNNHVGVVETEWRYQATNRWSLVGFIGTGYAIEGLSDWNWNANISAGGLGFRYLLARDYGLHVGIDVARGPEIYAWYLTIGSNWFR